MKEIKVPYTNPSDSTNLQRTGRVFGVSGKARSGKDSLFAIAALDGFKRLSFAAELKCRARADFGLTEEHTDGALKDLPCAELGGRSPREFLIDLGNLYRKYRDTFWVDIVIDTIKANPHESYMITDVRYPNEAEAIKSVGGEILRLERHPDRDGMVDEKTKQSISETALDDYKGFSYILTAEHNKKIGDLVLFWLCILDNSNV